ncbi:MAG: hypothetical protein AAF197_12285, partial [Pseudomonadota bacterium]
RKSDFTGDSENDAFMSLSLARLFKLGDKSFGISASYSPENDLDDSSFVIAAQLIGSGFYLELDEDDTVVIAYNYGWTR